MLRSDIFSTFERDSHFCCSTLESSIPYFNFLFSKFTWSWWTILLERQTPSLCPQYSQNSTIYWMTSFQVYSLQTMILGSAAFYFPISYLNYLFWDKLTFFPQHLISSPNLAFQAWSCSLHRSSWFVLGRVSRFLWVCRFELEDVYFRQALSYCGYSFYYYWRYQL